jgi:hypothetical protein
MMDEPKKQIYNDIWFFYKKYINGAGDDEYWETLNQEAQEIVAKHNGDMFARELALVVINELARKGGKA